MAKHASSPTLFPGTPPCDRSNDCIVRPPSSPFLAVSFPLRIAMSSGVAFFLSLALTLAPAEMRAPATSIVFAIAASCSAVRPCMSAASGSAQLSRRVSVAERLAPCSAVLPSLSCASALAPFSTSTRTPPGSEHLAAWCSAVFPSVSWMWTSARLLTRSDVNSRCPRWAVKCSAVFPCLSRTSGFAPASSSMLMMAKALSGLSPPAPLL
mmetsp:Transcript_15963/g.38136  ORF Transcript_15963/g.38136 Transcript_15963/m.38136 type:complete len:210 (+) Transcript_15963:1181-1810(+)